jgi:hypothetical protein
VIGYIAGMCGRYTLRTPWQRLAEHFGLRVTDLPEPETPAAPIDAMSGASPTSEFRNRRCLAANTVRCL